LLTKNRDKKLLSLVKPSDTNHDPAHTNHKGHSHEQ
jgi:hypothetical protein